MSLADLGLTDDASAVYRAMLREPSWTVDALVAHLDMSERAVRKALDQLADLQLLELDVAGSDRLALVASERGLAGLLADAEDDLRRRRARLEETRAQIAEIVEDSHARRDGGGFVRYDGVEQVRTRLRELSLSARREICSFSPGGAHQPDAMAASRDLNQAILARKVRIRAIYQDAFRNDPDTLTYAQWLTAEGGHLRTVPILPMQLVLVDGATAIVPTSPTEPRGGAVEVGHLGLVATIVALFEQVWQDATPFGEAPPAGKEGLTPQERRILLLLAEGATDEVVARKLGVSVRTLRRTIADLTERLGAGSRFEAGVKAARAGWL